MDKTLLEHLKTFDEPKDSLSNDDIDKPSDEHRHQ